MAAMTDLAPVLTRLEIPPEWTDQNGHIMFLVSIPAAKLQQLTLKVERFDSTLVERFRRPRSALGY